DNDHLYATHLKASNLSFTTNAEMPETFRCTAKFRYRQKDVGVTVHQKGEDGAVWVEFDEPARAITPGQASVFYQEDECLGGATIDEAYSEKEMLHYV